MTVKAFQMNALRKMIEVTNHSNLLIFSEQPLTLEDFLFSASFLLTLWDLLVKSSKKISKCIIKSDVQQI